MSLHSTLTLVVLGLGLSSSLRDIRTSKPLEEKDFHLGKTLDLRRDLVHLYPGTGGPVTPPEELRNNQTRGVFSVWPNGLIPYWISSDFSDNDRAMIANAYAYIEEHTCLRFAPDTDNMNPRMENLGGLCYTGLWVDGRGTHAEVRLTPSSVCTVPRTIVHELMHGVSFYHTHKREDRDLYIRIETDNIAPDQLDQFDYCSGCRCDTYGVAYDCSSVMHYARDQMSRNGR